MVNYFISVYRINSISTMVNYFVVVVQNKLCWPGAKFNFTLSILQKSWAPILNFPAPPPPPNITANLKTLDITLQPAAGEHLPTTCLHQP